MQRSQEVANGIAGICHMIQDNGGGIQSVRQAVETQLLDNFHIYKLLIEGI